MVRQLCIFAVMSALTLALTPARADFFDDMMGYQGKKLAKAIAKADAFPLGSSKNPVRVAMPEGERAYLRKLRCADGSQPTFERLGSGDIGPFGSIVDIYQVECAGSEPAKSDIFMDMYHGDPQETRAVPGFTIAGSVTITPKPGQAAS